MSPADTDRVQEAAVFAVERHRGQWRKGNALSVYAVHPLRVGEMLARYGFGADVVIAGFCHDLVEDTETTIDEISERFGERVAALVTAASEPDKAASWEDRKAATVETIARLDVEETALVVADKLDWHESVLADMAAGRDVWAQFKRGRDLQQPHFEHLGAEFVGNVSRLQDERLARLVDRYVLRHDELFSAEPS